MYRRIASFAMLASLAAAMVAAAPRPAHAGPYDWMYRAVTVFRPMEAPVTGGTQITATVRAGSLASTPAWKVYAYRFARDWRGYPNTSVPILTEVRFSAPAALAPFSVGSVVAVVPAGSDGVSIGCTPAPGDPVRYTNYLLSSWQYK